MTLQKLYIYLFIKYKMFFLIPRELLALTARQTETLCFYVSKSESAYTQSYILKKKCKQNNTTIHTQLSRHLALTIIELLVPFINNGKH